MPEENPTWTLDEARAYLPRLRGLLAILRRATDLAVRARGNGHSKLPDDPAVVSQQSADIAQPGGDPADDLLWGVSPRQALEELTERGVILRDPSRGLVDFPARHPNGRIVLLCWLDGEEDIEWWHLPEDGFGGRRPLPVPPDI